MCKIPEPKWYQIKVTAEDLPESDKTFSASTRPSIKSRGSEHYKTGSVEPIDLMKAGGILHHFAIGSIIKYAFRNRDKINPADMDKIIHYAEMLKEIADEYR